MQNLSTLLPIAKAQFSAEEQLCVNIRNVHKALGVGKDFSTWVKDRIAKYGFVEHEDYEKFATQAMQKSTDDALPKIGEPIGVWFSSNIPINGEQWQGRIDYYFTLESAKEIAMMLDSHMIDTNTIYIGSYVR